MCSVRVLLRLQLVLARPLRDSSRGTVWKSLPLVNSSRSSADDEGDQVRQPAAREPAWAGGHRNRWQAVGEVVAPAEKARGSVRLAAAQSGREPAAGRMIDRPWPDRQPSAWLQSIILRLRAQPSAGLATPLTGADLSKRHSEPRHCLSRISTNFSEDPLERPAEPQVGQTRETH